MQSDDLRWTGYNYKPQFSFPVSAKRPLHVAYHGGIGTDSCAGFQVAFY